VVAVGDADALAAAVPELLDAVARNREAMGAAARHRIATRYGGDALAERTGALLGHVARSA
jgi:hypothetical protein